MSRKLDSFEPDSLSQEAHVWLTHVNDLLTKEDQSRYESLLCADEYAKFRRFKFERDRVLYLTAHVLLRTTLSRYASVEPHEWRFSTNRYGRPEIALAGLETPLRFNLSHTHGLTACLVCLERDCGVDVEYVRPIGDIERLARTVFSPAELATLVATPEGGKTNHFYAYWTLKESYIKARGMGLALPLADFSFRFAQDGCVQIAFSEQLRDDPAHWQFLRTRATKQHDLAVAIRNASGSPLQIIRRFIVP